MNQNSRDQCNMTLAPAATVPPPGQLSSQEFQRLLYSWYEEKGLVDNLRSHLRLLMINKLRKTNIGRIDASKSNFSLTKQAFSLTIAEYLLREGCHYTLSIFSTEVPTVASQLPFSLFDAHCSSAEEWQFDDESVLNLLELMSITKGTIESHNILQLYQSRHGPLLSCIVGSKKSCSEEVISNEVGNSLTDYLRKALAALGVAPHLVSVLAIKVEEGIVQEKEKNAWEIAERFREKLNELQTNILTKDADIKVLSSENIRMKRENKRLRNEIKDTKGEIFIKEGQIRDEVFKERLESMKKLECWRKHCNEACKATVEKNLVLKAELAKLELEISNKRTNIESLNRQIIELTRFVESSQIKNDFLSACLQRSSEMSLKVTEPLPVSSDTSSANLTEDMLDDVRLKLGNLERESNELDGRYEKLQNIK